MIDEQPNDPQAPWRASLDRLRALVATVGFILLRRVS